MQKQWAKPLFAAIVGVMGGNLSAATVGYGTPGSPYTENFDILSSSAAPTAGYGWQQGAAISNNTNYNGGLATDSAGIAGFFAFTSNIAGATASMQDNPTGPRNFIGPDGTTPSAWSSINTYFAGETITSGSRIISMGSSTTSGAGGVADRALGAISGSTAHTAANGLWPGDNYMALVFQNTTGHSLDNFSMSYFAERWVDNVSASAGTVGNTLVPDLAHKGLLFTYKTTPTFTGAVTDIVTVPDDTSPYDASGNNGGLETNGFTAVHSLDALAGSTAQGDDFDMPTAGGGRVDGNLAANRHQHSAVVNTTWAAGDYLILRWFENDDSGNELGIGIDDLNFAANTVPEPASALLLGLGGMLAFSRRRLHQA
jgi:hypothetical protein